MIAEAVLAAGVGGLLWLDRFQFGQFMLSRPLVTASLVGLSLGGLKSGVAVGILFETLWLRRPPIGGYSPPDTTLAAAAAAAVAVETQRGAALACAGGALLAFLLILPVCGLGRHLDMVLRRLLAAPADEADAILKANMKGTLCKPFLRALLIGFLLAFAALVPIIFLGMVLAGEIEALLSPWIRTALDRAYFVAPLVGVADFSAGFETKWEVFLMVSGVVTVAATMSLLFWWVFFQ